MKVGSGSGAAKLPAALGLKEKYTAAGSTFVSADPICVPSIFPSRVSNYCGLLACAVSEYLARLEIPLLDIGPECGTTSLFTFWLQEVRYTTKTPQERRTLVSKPRTSRDCIPPRMRPIKRPYDQSEPLRHQAVASNCS
jgi:hypothetical protein